MVPGLGMLKAVDAVVILLPDCTEKSIAERK
jgi:hypothetical protein